MNTTRRLPPRPESPPRLRVVGSVALPDGRDAQLTAESLWGLYKASLELVDAGQAQPLAIVAISNDGTPKGAA